MEAAGQDICLQHSWKMWVWAAQCLQESCDCDTVWKTKQLLHKEVKSDSGRVEQQLWNLILKIQKAEKLHHSGFLWASEGTELYF